MTSSSEHHPVTQRIVEHLQAAAIEFRSIQHQPTFTSEESAAARGEPLHVGAKALLLKIDDRFALFILCADEQLDSSAVKRDLKVKSIRFATKDELMQMTGLVPGSVPPFGEPILPFTLYADSEVGRRENKVAFNAGSLTDSIVMQADDWQRTANPVRFRFGKPAG